MDVWGNERTQAPKEWEERKGPGLGTRRDTVMARGAVLCFKLDAVEGRRKGKNLLEWLPGSSGATHASRWVGFVGLLDFFFLSDHFKFLVCGKTRLLCRIL